MNQKSHLTSFTKNRFFSVSILSSALMMYVVFLFAEVGQNTSSRHQPSGNVVGVPIGVDVDAAHAHVLLFALLGVEVVLSKNNTPSPGSVVAKKCMCIFTAEMPQRSQSNFNLKCLHHAPKEM